MEEAIKAKNSPLVVLVTLNWNDAPNTLECLESVYQLDYPNFEVVVVDNHSGDGSPDQIASRYPQVHLIVNEQNLGFAGGVNVGLEFGCRLGADYLLLVNNDTVLDPHMLSELVTAGEDNPGAGLLTPKIYFYHDRTLIWSAGSKWVRFPPRAVIIGLKRRDHPRYDVMRRVQCATGCVLLIRREVLESVGYFDTVYFPLYHEDYDYCARVNKSGWEILYVPAAKLWHKDSQSQPNLETKAYNLGKNIVPFYLRHGNPPHLTLALFVAWAIGREVVKGKFAFILPYLKGVRAGLNRERSKTD